MNEFSTPKMIRMAQLGISLFSSVAAAPRKSTFWAPIIAALLLAVCLVAALRAQQAQAEPFAYVTEDRSSDSGLIGNVVVIDTATDTVVTNITVPVSPVAAAVTPDGKHVYVASEACSSSAGCKNVRRSQC